MIKSIRQAILPDLILSVAFMLLVFILVLLCGCAGSRPQPADDRHNAAIVTHPLPLDSTGLVRVPPLPPAMLPTSMSETSLGNGRDASLRSSRDASAAPKSGLLARIGHIFSSKDASTSSSKDASLRKCKGCTFNYVQGNQSTSTVGKKSTAAVGEGATSTSTTTGKKSGPAVIASDSVDLNSAGANSQQVVTTGDGNQVDAKKQDTTEEAPGPLAVLADNLTGPLGWVIGAAAVLVFLAWRAKRNNPMA